jgi:methionine aminopeptidase
MVLCWREKPQCAKAFKTKKVHKGVAFPTSISVNNVVCHNSPMDKENSSTLADGDLVKV